MPTCLEWQRVKIILCTFRFISMFEIQTDKQEITSLRFMILWSFIIHWPLHITDSILRPHTIDNVGNAVHQGEGKCQIANNTKAQQYG